MVIPMKQAPGAAAISLAIAAFLASVGVSGWLVFDKVTSDTPYRQLLDDRTSQDCEPWRATDVEHAECVVAWKAWQRCSRRVPSYDRQLGIFCTHPKFRFKERRESISEAIRQSQPAANAPVPAAECWVSY